MATDKGKNPGRKLLSLIKHFFHNHPAFQYIIKWTLISFIISLFIGSASSLFLKSLEWATDYRESNLWIIALLPVGGFRVGLLYHYYGKGSDEGNNLIIDTIHKPGKTIPLRMAPLVYLGSIATHLFGGSAGREGTALQMASSIADQFSRPFRLSESDRRTLIIASVAGGFGSVFGTPLAGAIFALEFFRIGHIRYGALFPAFITAIIAEKVTRPWQIPHTHYYINVIPEVSFQTIFYAIVAGILFGLCAMAFSRLFYKTGAIFKSKIPYAPLRPFVGGIIVAGAVWAIGTTKYIGLGIPTIVQSFDQQMPAYDFAIKMAFTIITISAGFKGGKVTPLFFIGATLGNALGLLLPLPTGLLAGMGFVAVFAGATNTPLACTVMAIELFGLECGLFVAIACIVSYMVSGHHSIYRRQEIGEPKHHRFSELQGERLSDL